MNTIPNYVTEMGFGESDRDTVIELLESLSQLLRLIGDRGFPTRIGADGIVTTFNNIEELNRTIMSLKMGVDVVWRPVQEMTITIPNE